MTQTAPIQYADVIVIGLLSPPSVFQIGHPDAAKSRGLHDDELQVLAFTSTVNGQLYLPWEDDESKENFKIPGLYKDIDGPLKLNPKQRENFGKWSVVCVRMRTRACARVCLGLCRACCFILKVFSFFLLFFGLCFWGSGFWWHLEHLVELNSYPFHSFHYNNNQLLHLLSPFPHCTNAPTHPRTHDCRARPTDISEKPKMFTNLATLSSSSIVQTIVTDCSFVCSLAISADYERRFKKQIISNKVWPRFQGQPAVNPSGKYMVKLHFNGVWRKVVIDDTLPISKDGRLLCSYTENKGELWVSMIEKAYLKVMGGYDFPGSNSAVDM